MSRQICPADKIVYKFVPRTFTEDQESPVPVEEIFSKMFREPTPFIGSYTQTYYPKEEDINQFFISQS
jgi:hypothetical protein